MPNHPQRPPTGKALVLVHEAHREAQATAEGKHVSCLVDGYFGHDDENWLATATIKIAEPFGDDTGQMNLPVIPMSRLLGTISLRVAPERGGRIRWETWPEMTAQDPDSPEPEEMAGEMARDPKSPEEAERDATYMRHAVSETVKSILRREERA